MFGGGGGRLDHLQGQQYIPRNIYMAVLSQGSVVIISTRLMQVSGQVYIGVCDMSRQKCVCVCVGRGGLLQVSESIA